MPVETQIPPRRRRIPLWLLLTITFAGIPIVCIAGFLVWLTSDADLRTFEAEAKRRGRPTTWAALGRTGQPEAVIALYRRVELATKAIKTWQAGDSSKRRITLGQPPPEGLREYWAGLDPTLIAELDAAVDALPRSCGSLYAEEKYGRNRVMVTAFNNTMRLYKERLVIAQPEGIGPTIDRSLHLAEAQPDPSSWMDSLVQVSLFSLMANTVIWRLADIPPAAAHTIADRVEALTHRMTSRPPRFDDGVFVSLLDEVKGMHTNPFQGEWHSLENLARCVANRAHRAPSLRRHLDWLDQLSTRHLDLESRWRLAASIAKSAKSWGSQHLSLVAGSLDDAREHIEKNAVRSLIQLELLAAELRRQPWPRDRFDPAARPLRPIHRNGQVIGAYSVYENGVDDGGNTSKDRCFPLYGPITLPAAP